MSPPALAFPAFPALHEWLAPAGWRAIDFISDLHLAEDTPHTFDAWHAYMQGSTADAICILGDLFEVWIGDDRAQSEFGARCLGVLRETAAHKPVSFMHGNRDFLLGRQVCADAGVTLLDDPTVLVAFGVRVLLSHGDELCLSDTGYQRFREQVRSAAWQRKFLAMSLADRHLLAQEIRGASEDRKRANPSMESWVDLDLSAALNWMDAADTPHFIHGHTHRPADQVLGAQHTRHVLSDWDLDHPETGARSEVLRLAANGFERLAPLDACRR